jgi:hypothetical protein
MTVHEVARRIRNFECEHQHDIDGDVEIGFCLPCLEAMLQGLLTKQAENIGAGCRAILVDEMGDEGAATAIQALTFMLERQRRSW